VHYKQIGKSAYVTSRRRFYLRLLFYFCTFFATATSLLFCLEYSGGKSNQLVAVCGGHARIIKRKRLTAVHILVKFRVIVGIYEQVILKSSSHEIPPKLKAGEQQNGS